MNKNSLFALAKKQTFHLHDKADVMCCTSTCPLNWLLALRVCQNNYTFVYIVCSVSIMFLACPLVGNN